MKFQDNKHQKENRTNNHFLIIGLFVVIVLICFSLIMALSAKIYFLQEKNNRELNSEIINLQKQISDMKNNEEETMPFLDFPLDESENQDESQVRRVSDGISWISPLEIDSLDFFISNDSYRGESAKYYKVGEFTGEHFFGQELIIVTAPYEGPAFYPGFYRFIRNSKTGEIIFLEKHSDEFYDGDGFDKEKMIINSTYTIPSLEFPETFIGQNSRQVLKLDKGVNKFFESENLEIVFTDKDLGNVYQAKENASVLLSKNGFYIEAPDGTVKIYSLKVDFVEENNVPNITWNNGDENKGGYTFTDVGGCGSKNYISIASNINIEKDLKIAGKNSKGDIIYEFKDVYSNFLQDYYKKITSWISEDEISYVEFVNGHPIFFWVDPFDRLIKFESNKFVSPAECAKPVIYLYPEQKSEISVKVKPKGGMSYSNPVYGDGWTVESDSASNITNLVSGKIYPYLFWEGRGAIYEQPQKGFAVERENIHKFLVEKLSKLGMNKKEIADFIEFWEPRMQDSPYYFVTFLGNREMEQLAPLDIAPKPDTVIRILMDFSPLSEMAEFEGFEIKTPERNGFTVVEWGGVLR